MEAEVAQQGGVAAPCEQVEIRVQQQRGGVARLERRRRKEADVMVYVDAWLFWLMFVTLGIGAAQSTAELWRMWRRK